MNKTFQNLLLLFAIACSLFFAQMPQSVAAQKHDWNVISDASKVQGPEACIECHVDTGRVWEGTHHFTTFREMPRSDRAREIADHLGIARIKTEPLCLSCHFSEKISETTAKAKPIAGISCESCHGAGQDWVDIHNDYGVGATKETETAEHKAKRMAMSEDAGMIHPGRLFAWAANCYSCHTVPDEKLVNMGGHPAGSKFELVSWSQGEVRHNVWHSGGKENVMATPERKRMMYVTGLALDLAYALNGLSTATEKAEYGVTMAKRAKAAMLRLEKVNEAVSVPEIKQILSIAGGVELSLNNQEPLTKAANQIAAAAKTFTESHDGSVFAAIDPLIPPADKYRGTPAS